MINIVLEEIMVLFIIFVIDHMIIIKLNPTL